MAKRFTVLIADFLDETSIESAVLDDLAELDHGPSDRGSPARRYLPQTPTRSCCFTICRS